MKGLVRIEARHFSRSILLWLGIALASAWAGLEIRQVWPTLSGDDGIAFATSLPLAAASLAGGAWLGLRDRRLKCAEVVQSTPTTATKLSMLRLLAIATVAGGAFGLLFMVNLVGSLARGGRGVPDFRLLADGALSSVLGGWLGFGVGAILNSRIIALLAAPSWAYTVITLGAETQPRLSLQWLSPVPSLPRRSVVLGFLPDIFSVHPLYLLGLVGVVGGAVLFLSGRGDGRVVRSALALILVGATLSAKTGAWLVAQPDYLVLTDPVRTNWIPVRASEDYPENTLFNPFPDRGEASACAVGDALEVCVFPAYGTRYAARILSVLEPEAELLAELPGIPHRLRMALGGDLGPFCGSNGEALLTENRSLYNLDLMAGHIAAAPFCGHPPSEAADAFKLWVELALGRADPSHVFDLKSASARAAAAMAQVPPGKVLADLMTVWNELRAGTLPAEALPGQDR